LCARVAYLAVYDGRSASPLDRMCRNRNTSRRQYVTALALAVLISSAVSGALRADDPSGQDLSMTLQNARGPFVTRSLAEHFALLILREKYPGAVFSRDSPRVVEKSDSWFVTVKVDRWNIPTDSGLLASQLTVAIRKTDAAVLSIK
jgi:hypothetical protein